MEIHPLLVCKKTKSNFLLPLRASEEVLSVRTQSESGRCVRQTMVLYHLGPNCNLGGFRVVVIPITGCGESARLVIELPISPPQRRFYFR